MTLTAIRETALVVLDAADAGAQLRPLASAAQLLCLIAQDAGTAHNGTAANERIFIRHAGTAFHGTELDLLLRSNGIAEIALTGGSVGQMALDAAEAQVRGYRAELVVPAEEFDMAKALVETVFAGRTVPPVTVTEAFVEVLGRAKTGIRNWHAETKAATLLATLDERLDPKHTAYVLIDVQNDFCRVRRSPTERFDLVDAALPNIGALLAAARETGCTIVHIQAEYGPMFRSPGQPYRYPGPADKQVVWTASASEFGVNGPPLPENEVEVCLAGSWGEQFTEIVPVPGEMVLRKHRYSAFVDTGLDVILRSKGIRTVVLVGVATNVCVESTARDASMRDFYVVVAEDSVANRSGDRVWHDNALAEIGNWFGMVVPAHRILTIWSRHKQAIESAA